MKNDKKKVEVLSVDYISRSHDLKKGDTASMETSEADFAIAAGWVKPVEEAKKKD